MAIQNNHSVKMLINIQMMFSCRMSQHERPQKTRDHGIATRVSKVPTPTQPTNATLLNSDMTAVKQWSQTFTNRPNASQTPACWVLMLILLYYTQLHKLVTDLILIDELNESNFDLTIPFDLLFSFHHYFKVPYRKFYFKWNP